MAKKGRITAALLRQLEREGYEVKRKGTFIRKTFIVEQGVLDEFMSVRGGLNIKVQDAISDALYEWTERNRGQKKSRIG